MLKLKLIFCREPFYFLEESKETLKTQLDRISAKRLESFVSFLQAKLHEQKSQILLEFPAKSFMNSQLFNAFSQKISKEGLSFVDCFDPCDTNTLLAIHESCYEAFPQVFEAFLSSFSATWGTLSQSELLQAISLKIAGFCQQREFSTFAESEKTTVFCEIARNLNEFPFNSFLRADLAENLKKRLFEGLKSLDLTLVEEKYLGTSVPEELFPLEYKEIQGKFEESLIKTAFFALVPENKRFCVWGLWKDHIRVVLKTNPRDVFQDLLEICEMLRKIAEIFNGGYKFHRFFGYLCENALDLGFACRFLVETRLEIEKSEVLKQFCRSCGWKFEEICEKNCECKKKVKVFARKPSLLAEDLEIINKLLRALQES